MSIVLLPTLFENVVSQDLDTNEISSISLLTNDLYQITSSSIETSTTVNSDVLIDSLNSEIIRSQTLLQSITGTDFPELITGTASGDVINGLGGNDTLMGMQGDDIIDGGSGNDQIIGGSGGDFLVGGAGSDNFVYRGVPDFSANVRERISDFQIPGLFGIGGDKLLFSTSGTGIIDLSQFQYDSSTGALRYFSNPMFDPNPVGIIVLENVPTFSVTRDIQLIV